MAESLGISAMAVRQHLQELEDEGSVCSNEQVSGVGRPSKLWKLTAYAEREHFPDGHRELSVDLIEGLSEVLDEDGLEKVLDGRRKRQATDYRERFRGLSTVWQKAQALAALRSAEGYMAEARQVGEGVIELIENHCPVCDAASKCALLCSNELALFRELMGKDVAVDRTEHIMGGSRRCVYRIENAGVDYRASESSKSANS